MKHLRYFSLVIINFLLLITPCFSQTITTVAGDYFLGYGFSGDGGPATSAEVEPLYICFDTTGNYYIADDDNFVIRKVNTTGIISTFAGSPLNQGYYGDGGPATLAEMGHPNSICIDSFSNLYVADQDNDVIRKINILSGIITSVAGNNSFGHGYSGDGGQATLAELCGPSGVATDKWGDLYIADQCNEVIRKVVLSTGIISTVAGNYSLFVGYTGDGGPATSAQFSTPGYVGVDGNNNIYISDEGNYVIRKVNSSGVISTLAGNHACGAGYSGDGGPATLAELSDPRGLTVDIMGNIYTSDFSNNIIREVNVSGLIYTVAGNYAFGAGYSGDGGPATSAELHYPDDVIFDSKGNFYISEIGNLDIRKVSGLLTANKELTANDEKISLFPNPSNGVFTIQSSVVSGQLSVEVYNVMGEKITPTLLPQSRGGASFSYSINLSGQPNGVYFYRVITENGNLVGDGKIIIQR